MSRQDHLVVPLGRSGPARRTAIERLMLLLPSLYRLGSRIVLRLPRNLGLRRVLVSRFTARTMAAFSRNDPHVVQLRASRDISIKVSLAPDSLHLEPAYRGYEGIAELLGRVHEEFPDTHWEPERRIELPDGRFVNLSRLVSGGRPTEFAQILWLERGVAVSEEIFIGSWAEAIKAAGLSE